MSSSRNARVITISDLDAQSVPTLRLRSPLPERPRPQPHQSSWIPNIGWDFMGFEFVDMAGAELAEQVDEAATTEATERNAARIDKVFDDLQKQMEKQRKQAKEELKNLTPKQQEDAVAFWQAVQEFLMDVLHWLQMQFQRIVEKLREGWRLVKKTVREIFNKVKDAIKQVMSFP